MTLTGFAEFFTALDSDYFENKVWMLMKVLFENKQFIVDINGAVAKQTSNKNLISMQPNSVAYITAKFFSRNLSTGELKLVNMK